MQLKAADDRQPDLDALAALLARDDLDDRTRGRVESEIRQIRAGIVGERDAAYEIEFESKDRPSRVTIHDLRLEHDGRVAQIDHLIITRMLDFWVLESKHFSEGVAIDDFGEWTAFYNRRPWGIPSPIEQNARHVAVLEDLLRSPSIDLPKRLGMTIRPRVRSLVLVSNGARISRPKSRVAREALKGLETVIKVEKLSETMGKDAEQRSIGAIAKLVGTDQTERIGRALVALHRPASFDWAAKFGIAPIVTPTGAVQPDVDGSVTHGPSAATCARCAKAVSAAVVTFCQTNTDRFGGSTYCYQCQRSLLRSPQSAS